MSGQGEKVGRAHPRAEDLHKRPQAKHLADGTVALECLEDVEVVDLEEAAEVLDRLAMLLRRSSHGGGEKV